jgi:hypothetical protein
MKKYICILGMTLFFALMGNRSHAQVPPTTFFVEANSDFAFIRWLPSTEESRYEIGYKVRYREVGSSSYQEIEVSDREVELPDLLAGTNYEFCVATKKALWFYGEFSPWQQFSTLP